MPKNTFDGLLEQLEENFQAMDSDITTTLLEREPEYAALRKRLGELEQQYPIETWLEGKGAVSLSAADHAALVEYMSVTFEVENRERLNLYLAGHRDCFAYLKRIGLV